MRGRFYWTRLPDEPDAKVRPALVVSGDVRNRFANDVMLVPPRPRCALRRRTSSSTVARVGCASDPS